MQAQIGQRSTAQWVALLEHKAVPCGPINDVGQAFADAQVKARGLQVMQARPAPTAARDGIAQIASVASPLRLVDTPPVLHRPPPALGEHNIEVLTELGYSTAQISALGRDGVI